MLTMKKLQEQNNKLNENILRLKKALNRRQIAEIFLEYLKRDFDANNKANKTITIKVINKNDDVITNFTITDTWEDWGD